MVSADIVRFADELATLSGDIILPLFRTDIAADNKAEPGDFDPVTEADRAAERIMRERIRAVFPSHGIEGEEYGDEQSDADYVWVLDPIDGTRAFISGLPLWGTLIGLKHKGKPVFGLMHQPFIGERFWGSTEGSFYRRGDVTRPLRTRACPALDEATLSTTSPAQFKGPKLERYLRVEQGSRLTRYGYDCYAYSMLAAGQIDLVVESGLKPCDIVALAPIIEGAGGAITSWNGGSITDGGDVIAAGDKQLHATVMGLLS